MDAARTLLLFTLLEPFPDPLLTLLIIPPRLLLLSDLFTFTLPMLLRLLLLLLIPLLFEIPKLELFTLHELIFILCRPPGLEL